MAYLKVADYSGGRPSPEALVTAGYMGVVRYAPGSVAANHITKAEVDALKAVGLAIAVVIQVGTKFVTEGHARGALEAARSVEMTRAAGLPDGDVYVAVDFDATLGGTPTSATALAQMEQIALTFEGVASVVGRDHVRPYGGFHTLTWLYKRCPWLKPGWQPRAWSQVAGVVTYHPNIALIQHWPSITVGGGLIDHNDGLLPDWGQRVPPAPTPPVPQETPMNVATALASFGWVTNTPDRLVDAIEDFQGMWNLGPALSVDGDAGAKTRAAIELSLARQAAGKGNISASFSAAEFRCRGTSHSSSCRRIWTPRKQVKAAEAFRTLVGPYSPARGCRCPAYNKAVGGVSNSQHLYGRGMDVPVFDITPRQLKALGVATGIGAYVLPNGKRVVRHFDTRAGATVTDPAEWDYGSYSGVVLTPKPTAAPSVPAPAPAPTPTTRWTRTDVTNMQRLLETGADGVWGAGTELRAQAFRAVASSTIAHTATQLKMVQGIVDVSQDGSYGPGTRAAVAANVKVFQRILKVAQDGSWGLGTDKAYAAFHKEWRGR